MILWWLVWIAGIVSIGKWIWTIFHDFYVFVLAPYLGHSINLKEAGGDWAVVTGAGAGIGRGYSVALAKKGINVCLIGRTESKLLDVAKIIEDKYKVQTKVIVHDFSKINVDDSEILKRSLGDLLNKIGILINNVGIMGGDDNFVIPFVHNTPNPIDYGREMVNVNIQSMILMTGLFLPLFIKCNRGIIVNLSSSCGIRPFYGHSVYSSTKSFADFFSESIRQECVHLNTNVIVQSIQPFFVRTQMVPIMAYDTLPHVLQPCPDSFAESSVETIGLQKHTSGCLFHNIQLRSIRLLEILLPKIVVDWLQKHLALAIRNANQKYRTKLR